MQINRFTARLLPITGTLSETGFFEPFMGMNQIPKRTSIRCLLFIFILKLSSIFEYSFQLKINKIKWLTEL